LQHRNEERKSGNSALSEIDVWLGNGHWEGKQGLHYWAGHTNLDEGRYNILCDFESRNNHEAWENKFDRILTLDADIVEWRNNILGERKYVYVYTPISDHWFDMWSWDRKKLRDVIVCGTINDKYLLRNMLNPIADFNNEWVGDGRTELREGINRGMRGEGYPEKMELISKCKVSVCWNAVPVSYEAIKQMLNDPSQLDNPTHRHVRFLRNPNDTWPQDFSKLFGDRGKTWAIDGNMKYLKPQLKTRAFEAAACKSLILSCYDDFHHLNYWFNEGEDFVYFQPGKLGEKLTEILEDYSSYDSMRKSAHAKASQHYKTSNFWNDFIATFTPKVVNQHQ